MKKTQSLALPAFLMLGPIMGCGGSSSSSPAPAPLPPIQASFVETSSTYQIPQDMLLAVLHKESGIATQASSSIYANGEAVGPKLAQTSMGVPRENLNIEAGEAGDGLKTQLDAYGRWVKANLEATHVQLPAQITKNDDIYDWAWQLSQMHLPSAPKNLRILFVLEVLKTLNEGFIWQDPASDERLQLNPRNPPLELSSFSETVQANLKLDLRDSELASAQLLQMNYVSDSVLENRPTKVRIIHCPFSLSTCLGTQLQSSKSGDLSLQAHYVIPPEGGILKNPVKILQHRTPVALQNENGTSEIVTDSIVMMLVGNSGRIVNGERTQTNPTWYSVSQLQRLGELVSGVCQLMVRDNPFVNLQDCMKPGSGVVFADPASHAQALFGDIPDFDNNIFSSFIENPSGMNGEVQIRLSGGAKLFAAGAAIPLSFNFIKGTTTLEVQRLQRCESGKTVWTVVQNLPLRSVDQTNITMNLYDQGPNRNGQQFIRAVAYGNGGVLMGWATQDLYLSNFDREAYSGANLAQCRD